MPVRLIWRLRRKFQITNHVRTKESKKKSKIVNATMVERYNTLSGLKSVMK